MYRSQQPGTFRDEDCVKLCVLVAPFQHHVGHLHPTALLNTVCSYTSVVGHVLLGLSEEGPAHNLAIFTASDTWDLSIIFNDKDEGKGWGIQRTSQDWRYLSL